MSKKTLFYFVNTFPFGYGEPFVSNELNVLSKQFDEVILVTGNSNLNGPKQVIPNNVTILSFRAVTVKDKKKVFLNPIIFLKIIFGELLFSRQKKLFLKELRNNVNYVLHAIVMAKLLQKEIAKKNNALTFYSYWFYDWNLVLSILKSSSEIGNNFSRAHGFDLYENNGKEKLFAFQKI